MRRERGWKGKGSEGGCIKIKFPMPSRSIDEVDWGMDEGVRG